MPTRLTIRFDFDGERRLGPGKVALLEAIRRPARSPPPGARIRCPTGAPGCWWKSSTACSASRWSRPIPAARKRRRRRAHAGRRGVVALYREAERKMREAAADEIERIEGALAK